MEKKNKKSIIKEILSYVIIILIVLLVKMYIVSPIRVNGSSMYKTLHDQDVMILNEFIYYFNDVERFDIVVIDEDDQYIIKRVYGLPGEKIKCVGGNIYINNKKIKDKYASSKTEDFDEVVIGKNEYFVLGDNREVSLDSRMFGTYSKKDIIGKASFTVFPFSRFGSKA